MELIVVYFMECLLEFIGIESMFFFSFSFFLRYVKLFVKFPIIFIWRKFKFVYSNEDIFFFYLKLFLHFISCYISQVSFRKWRKEYDKYSALIYLRSVQIIHENSMENVWAEKFSGSHWSGFLVSTFLLFRSKSWIFVAFQQWKWTCGIFVERNRRQTTSHVPEINVCSTSFSDIIPDAFSNFREEHDV